MTMRAEIERNTATATDSYGGPVPAVYEAHGTVACFVWSTQRRQVLDGDKTALVEDLRALFPLRADVREGDRIAQVTDRRGRLIRAGKLRIETLTHKHRHLEAGLEIVA